MATTHSTHDVIVIGAGFSGMYLIRRLRDELGLDVQLFERGDNVGGTWYWNRYPGARCDIESMFYCYSVDDELQQEWVWTERYPTQPEILKYANHVADRWDVRRSITFNTRVERAEWSEDSKTWTITTDTGDTATAPYLVTAVGCLSETTTPSFPDMHKFQGPIYHTGDWPHEGVDFTGKRVGLIGTGSSGVQSIPVIAEQAADLTVFQRTAQYSVPARTRPLTDIERQVTKANYPVLRQLARVAGRSGTVSEAPMGPLKDVDPVQLRAELERRWWHGSIIVGTLSDTVVSPEANEVVAEFVREKIRETVKDAKTAELLAPDSYPIGTKRIILDTNYFETYNRPNVHLVDIRDTPVERFTEKGLVVDGTEYEFDAIVLATGFDAMTGALTRIDIRGKGGQKLKDAWSEGPKSYLGLAVHGFPNLFTVTGPGSPSVLSNMIVSIEQHVDWITDYIKHLRENGVVEVEADAESQDEWVAHVSEVAHRTLYPVAASWYMGANIPGKPRVFMPYIGGVGPYRKICDDVRDDGYRGFVHRSKEAALAGAGSSRA